MMTSSRLHNGKKNLTKSVSIYLHKLFIHYVFRRVILSVGVSILSHQSIIIHNALPSNPSHLPETVLS